MQTQATSSVSTRSLASSLLTSRGRPQMPRLIVACIVILAIIIVAALFAPIITPHDPAYQTLTARLSPPAGFEGALSGHLLGTDHLGRDILSRLVYGARVSLGIGVLGMTIGATAGILLGLLAGFRKGIIDEVIMLLVDAQMALPLVVMALIAIAIFGTGLTVLILIVSLAGWDSHARLTRSMVLSVRERQFVLAAQASGAGRGRIMFRHVLPNITSPLIVLASFQLTAIILLESSLSFLGIGVQPPTPSWGSMIGEGRDFLATAWWIAVFPGIAIVLTTMTISLFGDWLRDVLDPTLQHRQTRIRS